MSLCQQYPIFDIWLNANLKAESKNSNRARLSYRDIHRSLGPIVPLLFYKIQLKVATNRNKSCFCTTWFNVMDGGQNCAGQIADCLRHSPEMGAHHAGSTATDNDRFAKEECQVVQHTHLRGHRGIQTYRSIYLRPNSEFGDPTRLIFFDTVGEDSN